MKLAFCKTAPAQEECCRQVMLLEEQRPTAFQPIATVKTLAKYFAGQCESGSPLADACSSETVQLSWFQTFLYWGRLGRGWQYGWEF